MELKSRIDAAFLPIVTKPTRFLGNEFETIVKKTDEVQLRIALCFAGLYDEGMCNIAFDALYHTMNDAREIWAERCYYPGEETEPAFQSAEIPLFSLESKTALDRFDLIIFFVQEMAACTNVLAMLNLAAVPLRQSDRDGTLPLVIGCGPAMSNPEPMAAFFDAVIIGDAEETLLDITKTVIVRNGSSRQAQLKALARPGVYVPSLYEPRYSRFGEYQGLAPLDATAPARIAPRAPGPGIGRSVSFKPLGPLTDISVQSHAFEEISAPFGDTQGAAAIRHQSAFQPRVQVQLHRELQAHLRKLENLPVDIPLGFTIAGNGTYWALLKDKFLVEENRVTESLADGRLSFRKLNTTEAALDIKQSPFVLSVHAGTPRLRTLVNSSLRDADLLAAIKAALEKGWTAIQLNFTIGLPTEKTDDVLAIAETVRMCVDAAQPFPDTRLIVSLQIFYPKPHTPFQWEKPESSVLVEKKLALLSEHLQSMPVQVVHQQPQAAEVYGMLARGDRHLADIIESAWRHGARHEGAFDVRHLQAWNTALSEFLAKTEGYRSAVSITVALPWDHIDPGVTKSHLKEEKLRALQGQLHPLHKDIVSLGPGGIKRDEFERYCQSGATPHRIVLPGQSAPAVVAPQNEPVRFGRRGKKKQMPTAVIKRKVRVRYAKTGAMRYLSHLDIVRVFERCAKLASIPLVYSQGLRRNPKIAYGMPLPTGISSTAEYLDMEVEMGRELDLQDRFNAFLPEGIRILQYQGIFSKVPALAAVINRTTYETAISAVEIPQAWIDEWLAQTEAMILRQTKDGPKDIDIRPFVNKMYVEKDVLHVEIEINEGRSAKISEVLESLLSPRGVDYRFLLSQRTEQLIADGSSVKTPFEVL